MPRAFRRREGDYILYNFYGSTIMIKGSLLVRIPHYKASSKRRSVGLERTGKETESKTV